MFYLGIELIQNVLLYGLVPERPMDGPLHPDTQIKDLD